MKKTFYLSLIGLFLLSAPAFSQIEKGNVLAGGDIANFDLGVRKGSGFTMNIDPTLAFFIKDNVAIGPYISLGVASFPGSTTFNYGVGALGRYYFSDKNNMAPLRHSRFFVEANAGIKGINQTGGVSTNGIGLGVGPGYAYFITPSIGLEVLLKYNEEVGFGNATTQGDLDLRVGFQIYLPSHNLKTKVVNDVK